MGILKLSLPNDLEERFRQTVASIKGLHKGVLSECGIEAIKLWLDQQQVKPLKQLKKSKSPPLKPKPSIQETVTKEDLTDPEDYEEQRYCRDCSTYQQCSKTGQVRRRKGLACDDFVPYESHV
jgi:hypothetical protein